MRAHNRGVALCATELFLCLDSDDYLVQTAVEEILKNWESFSHEQEAEGNGFGNLAGLVAHKGKSETELLYDVDFPKLHTTTLFGLYLHGFQGETTLIFRTEILREFPFPEIDGEKYVPEDYIYDKCPHFQCRI